MLIVKDKMPEQPLLSKRATYIFLGALLGLLLSKGMAVLPGYALDDYTALLHDRYPLLYRWQAYFWQGRYTQGTLQLLLMHIGVTPTSIAWPSTILFLILAAVAVTVGILYLTKQRGSALVQASIAAVIGAHPYLTEYFTFREALITQAMSFALLALIFTSLMNIEARTQGRARYIGTLWLTIPLIALAGAQQTAFLIAVFFVTARLITDAAPSFKAKNLKQSLVNNAPILLGLVVSSLIHVILFSLSRKFAGARTDPGLIMDPRPSVITAAEIIPRLTLLGELAQKILLQGEPILSQTIKYLLLALTLGFTLKVSLSNMKVAIWVAVIFATMFAGSIFFIFISGSWWPVPRAMYGIGFTFGITVATLSVWLRPEDTKPFLVLASATALGLCFHSSAMLNDQLRLNRWDLWIAGQIAKDLSERKVSPHTRIQVVGAGWKHPIGPKTTQGDINVSALAIDWAIRPLFAEATGRDWNVDSIARMPEVCSPDAYWPSPDSIRVYPERVVVCMGSR
jgi:hypothetical protein